MVLGELSAMANLALDDQDGVSRSISDSSPTHYTVKIKLFSLLTKNNIERYDSSNFEAGGYKWKLAFYPNGNKNKNVTEHISVYVAMAEESSLLPGWEVYAVFRLFLLDQFNDNYLTLQDMRGKGRRFHEMKLEWGFDQFIPLKVFNDACNGYLVEDACVFGAEVFVCKERNRGKAERLSMIKEAITYKHSWKIENFWKFDSVHESKTFIAGDQKWKIHLYPLGKGNGMGSHVSLYLVLADASSLPPGSKIFAEFTLRILDQVLAKHYFHKANSWFSASSLQRGWSRFYSFDYFYQPSMGFLMKDSCSVEAEVAVLGVVNALR